MYVITDRTENDLFYYGLNKKADGGAIDDN